MKQTTRAAILTLPHMHHPRLQPLVMHLANREGVDFRMALDLLEEMRAEMGISTMDLEFAAPNAAPRVRFVPARTGSPISDYQEMVSGHLQRILRGNG